MFHPLLPRLLGDILQGVGVTRQDDTANLGTYSYVFWGLTVDLALAVQSFASSDPLCLCVQHSFFRDERKLKPTEVKWLAQGHVNSSDWPTRPLVCACTREEDQEGAQPAVPPTEERLD